MVYDEIPRVIKFHTENFDSQKLNLNLNEIYSDGSIYNTEIKKYN